MSSVVVPSPTRPPRDPRRQSSSSDLNLSRQRPKSLSSLLPSPSSSTPAFFHHQQNLSSAASSQQLLQQTLRPSHSTPSFISPSSSSSSPSSSISSPSSSSFSSAPFSPTSSFSSSSSFSSLPLTETSRSTPCTPNPKGIILSDATLQEKRRSLKEGKREKKRVSFQAFAIPSSSPTPPLPLPPSSPSSSLLTSPGDLNDSNDSNELSDIEYFDDFKHILKLERSKSESTLSSKKKSLRPHSVSTSKPTKYSEPALDKMQQVSTIVSSLSDALDDQSSAVGDLKSQLNDIQSMLDNLHEQQNSVTEHEELFSADLDRIRESVGMTSHPRPRSCTLPSLAYSEDDPVPFTPTHARSRSASLIPTSTPSFPSPPHTPPVEEVESNDQFDRIANLLNTLIGEGQEALSSESSVLQKRTSNMNLRNSAEGNSLQRKSSMMGFRNNNLSEGNLLQKKSSVLGLRGHNHTSSISSNSSNSSSNGSNANNVNTTSNNNENTHVKSTRPRSRVSRSSGRSSRLSMRSENTHGSSGSSDEDESSRNTSRRASMDNEDLESEISEYSDEDFGHSRTSSMSDQESKVKVEAFRRSLLELDTDMAEASDEEEGEYMDTFMPSSPSQYQAPPSPIQTRFSPDLKQIEEPINEEWDDEDDPPLSAYMDSPTRNGPVVNPLLQSIKRVDTNLKRIERLSLELFHGEDLPEEYYEDDEYENRIMLSDEKLASLRASLRRNFAKLLLHGALVVLAHFISWSWLISFEYERMAIVFGTIMFLVSQLNQYSRFAWLMDAMYLPGHFPSPADLAARIQAYEDDQAKLYSGLSMHLQPTNTPFSFPISSNKYPTAPFIAKRHITPASMLMTPPDSPQSALQRTRLQSSLRNSFVPEEDIQDSHEHHFTCDSCRQKFNTYNTENVKDARLGRYEEMPGRRARRMSM